APAELARDRAGEAHEPGLRRRVVRLPRDPEEARDARDEDDAPAARADHALDRALDGAEGPAEVRIDDGREVVVGHAHEQRVLRDARVRDDGRDGAELGLHLRHGRVERRAVVHVRAHREGVLRALAAACCDGDAVPVAHEALGDRAADAAVSSRDEDDAVGGGVCAHGDAPGRRMGATPAYGGLARLTRRVIPRARWDLTDYAGSPTPIEE